MFMPDTPHYFVTKGDRTKAIESLRYLRMKSGDDVKDELLEIQASVDESLSHKAGFFDMFRGRANVMGKQMVQKSQVLILNETFDSF